MQDDPSQVRPNLIPPGEFSVEVQQAWVKPGRVDPFHLGCLLKDLVTNRVRTLYLSSIVICDLSGAEIDRYSSHVLNNTDMHMHMHI